MSALPEKFIQSLVPDQRIKEVLSVAPVDPKDKPYNDIERDNRYAFIRPILDQIESGLSQNKAIKLALDRVGVSDHYAEIAKRVAVGNKAIPSKSSIAGWLKKYREEGMDGLRPNRIGKQPVKEAPWKAEAMKLFHLPSKPAVAAVHRLLIEEYKFEVSYHQVLSFFNNLPAQLGHKSPYRIGTRLHNNTQTHSYNRTTKNLPVGHIFTGDGHTIDVYFKHPATGDIWRAELIVWMDVRSRYIVGWAIDEAENAYGTINALSMAVTKHNHVCPRIHVDNGSGYKSRMMNKENTGFYDRMSMETIFAIPGNPHGKGRIERFFRTMEEDLNVFFGSAFCGNGHSKEHLRNFVNACKRGKAEPVDMALWCEAFENWLTKYHNRPHPEEKHTTPAELWSQLECIPPHMSFEAMRRPHVERVVSRGEISLDNRIYRAPELLAFNGKTVIVEYDYHTDAAVVIRYQDQFICAAKLNHKPDFLPESRIEEDKQKSLAAAEKRLQRKLDEKRARAGNLIDGTAVAKNSALLIEGAAEPRALPKTKIKLDLTDI